jgi:hypothetical protein
MSTDNTATTAKKEPHFNLVLREAAEDLDFLAGHLDKPRAVVVRQAIKALRASLTDIKK